MCIFAPRFRSRRSGARPASWSEKSSTFMAFAQTYEREWGRILSVVLEDKNIAKKKIGLSF